MFMHPTLGHAEEMRGIADAPEAIGGQGTAGFFGIGVEAHTIDAQFRQKLHVAGSIVRPAT